MFGTDNIKRIKLQRLVQIKKNKYFLIFILMHITLTNISFIEKIEVKLA